MPLTLPSFAPAWLLARDSQEAALALLTIEHPHWGVPQRLVRNPVQVTSRGEVFQPAWFEFDVVSDADGPPRAELRVPNVSPEIGRMLERLPSPPRVTLEVIGDLHPDEPIYRAAHLELRDISLGAVAITGTLVSRNFEAELCGTIHVTPGRFPALFRAQ